MKRSRGDDHIVQSTQTELAFFLVIVFVMLLGFQVTEEDRVGGLGDRAQGDPADQGQVVDEPAPSEPLPPPTASDGAESGWAQSADRALRSVKSCKVIRSEDRHSFVLPTGEDTADGSRSLTFGVGDNSISTELWQNCLSELFQALIQTYQEQKSATRFIVIQGHTSSEWNVAAGCPEVAGTSQSARQSIVAFKCNRALSLKRADEIFEAGYFFNDLWFERGADQSLPPAEFAEVFRTEGRSSLDVLRDDLGNEIKSLSRRVEFVFVGNAG